MTMPNVLDRLPLVALLSLAAGVLPAAEPTSTTLEKQLDGSAKKFEVNFTLTYYFE
jgi:hypothetical protein